MKSELVPTMVQKAPVARQGQISRAIFSIPPDECVRGHVFRRGSSFMPQCCEWVNLCGSSGRQIAGQQSDHSQHKCNCSEGFGIVGADAEQQATHKVHEAQTCDK